MAHAQEALTLKPHRASTLFNLACYQALLNKDVKEILPNLQEAIRLKPELRENLKTDPDLESLRALPEVQQLINPT